MARGKNLLKTCSLKRTVLYSSVVDWFLDVFEAPGLHPNTSEDLLIGESGATSEGELHCSPGDPLLEEKSAFSWTKLHGNSLILSYVNRDFPAFVLRSYVFIYTFL